MLRIGIDLGGTKTEGIVMDSYGEILVRRRSPTPQQDGYQAVLENIRRLILELQAATGGKARHVGIGTPGSISVSSGLLKNSNTVCLNEMPVAADLQELLRLPLRIANDANCFALSEALDGAGRGRPVVFGVIMGTGVGGGIVVHGKVLEGLQHIAGEWGHNVLERDGPICYCGRRGCVETLISGPGLAADYVRHGGEPGLELPALAERAQQGDAAAEAAIVRFLERFGRALATVINILDPDIVVLGGGLSNMRRLLAEGPAYVAPHVFNDEFRTPIVRNAHGDSSGVRGAALLWPADQASKH